MGDQMFNNQAADAVGAVGATGSTGKARSRRGRVAGAAVAVGALIAVGIAAHAEAASTPGSAGTAGTPVAVTSSPNRPATAPVAHLAEPGLGSGNLLQSEAFFQQGLSAVGATVDLTGKQALSACSGEETMRTLTKGKAAAYADVTWTFDTADSLLTESVADGSTSTAAASYEKQLNALVRDCQDEPDGHWYYGKAHPITLPTGEGHWYPSFNGNGEVAGGVAVIRSGHRVGIVELTGQPTNDPTYIEGITATALNQLAG
ncbi:hypothetical protein ACEZDB_33160 [Streptacidiphilus sp. N1-3]|uniref:PknH-like extracellular domain-containing protein n=1 Tax=Streptacidiphilus alkalitolerans TaxID=3342712 RepID=A0ABV6XB82_9ACTN